MWEAISAVATVVAVYFAYKAAGVAAESAMHARVAADAARAQVEAADEASRASNRPYLVGDDHLPGGGYGRQVNDDVIVLAPLGQEVTANPHHVLVVNNVVFYFSVPFRNAGPGTAVIQGVAIRFADGTLKPNPAAISTHLTRYSVAPGEHVRASLSVTQAEWRRLNPSGENASLHEWWMVIEYRNAIGSETITSTARIRKAAEFATIHQIYDLDVTVRRTQS